MTSKKPFYKNIFIITSQEGREYLFEENIKSPAIQQAIKQKDLILICIGDKKKTEIKDSKYSTQVKFLYLNHEESYYKLSGKTLKAIKYCCKKFTFDRLHKLDDNKMINEEVYDINKNDFDLQGCSTQNFSRKYERYVKKSKNICLKIETDYLRQGLVQVKKRTFRRWADAKGRWVDQWHLDESVWYSNWKPYSVSFNFAKILANADEHENFYNSFLLGCEDHFVGKVYKDLELYFNLTAE